MQRSRSSRTGRVKTVPRQDDPEIQRRLDMVETVYRQPASRALGMVNRWLEQNGKPPIGLEQYRKDRDHVRERFQELVPGGLVDHVEWLLMEEARVDREIGMTPAGPARAPLYALRLRLHEDLMKIDGTWGAGRGEVGYQVDEQSFGPSPQELVAAGEITADDHRRFLYVLAQTTGGRKPRLVGSSGPEDVEEAPPAKSTGRQVKRGGRGATPAALPPPPPGMPRMADQVVDWQPEQEAFG